MSSFFERTYFFNFTTFELHLKPANYIYLIATLLLWSCQEGVLVDQFHDIPNSEWEYETEIVDTCFVKQPEFYHQIYANLRISGEYKYANIHLLLATTQPDGEVSKHKIPLDLAEKSGKWLGSGLGDVITFQIPILHRKYLNQKGKYRFEITQDMRLNPLPSVLSAGIRVEQQEEIF